MLRKKKGRDNPAFQPDSGVMLSGIEPDEEETKRRTQYMEPLKSENEEERKSTWDVFRVTPSDASNEPSQEFFAFFHKVFRLLAIVVIFIVLLGAAVLSKSTLLFASSQLRSDQVLNCKTDNIANVTYCVARPKASVANQYELSCLNKTENMVNEPVLPRQICPAVTIRWIWSLFLMMVTPYALVFLQSIWLICFKTKRRPTADVLLFVLLQESLYCVGMSIFVFRVLPYMDDIIQSLALMTGVGFLPGLLRILSRPSKQKLWILQLALDIAAFAAQVSALVLLPVLTATKIVNSDNDLMWSVPLSLVLMSLSWWENYIDKDTKLGALLPAIVSFKVKIRRCRTKMSMISSIWKIILTFLLLFAFSSRELNISDLFNWDYSSSRCGNLVGPIEIPKMEWDWLSLWGINAGVGVVAYFCARTAAKVNIQRISYAIPLVLSTPIVFGSLVGMCESWNNDPCRHDKVIPSHVFWNCYPRGGLGALFTQNQKWMLILWWLSQLWIARHIFFPSKERLMKTERLFVLPLFDNIIIEQWLMHNRRRTEEKRKSTANRLTMENPEYTHDDVEEELAEISPQQRLLNSRNETPLIYICATMWHESEAEMIMLLKSLFRLDIDQWMRKTAQIHLQVVDPDYYEFEAHIFFDDAMQNHLMEEHKYKCNDFVKLLVSVISTAASAVHERELEIDPPVRYPTPYGGRLEWNMPLGNKIIAHLKDKAKIRHKKRWSQVMYMYYFLGFKLWAQEPSIKKKSVRADNTFLLALDGDVDFQPHALMKLVDLMKKDPKMGAACGRIHPIGAGPMVWYQKFEYALGHWMQKATEHVLGCVLCSPGCFSLFRGTAIMDDNVMKRYTTMSTEAKHYVQYDQGEDRWLCTLLLQQGYRVEYSAASDSYTNAPEGFNEFYNQRRRWMPSTMANIMDLLLSWRHTIKANDNISLLYIGYQTGLFISSILGTGTIFLMIVGALQVALNGAIDNWTSLLINIVPVLLFVLVCYKAKPDTQLSVAAVLTTIYALMQMLVLVGIIIQIGKNGVCSPTAIFFFYVAGTFILAAILHPQEFFCVINGFIYFISIPSMYMLLMMYSLTNLHVVSWGTREVKPTPTEEADAAQKEMEKNAKEAENEEANKLTAMIKRITSNLTEEKGWTAAVGSWCRFTCCPKPATSEESVKFEAILAKLDQMEGKMQELQNKTSADNVNNAKADTQHEPTEEGPRKVSFGTPTVIKDAEATIVYDDSFNPYWMEDEDLGRGPVGTISEEEWLFFKDLIKTYLFPLEKNKSQEERVAMELLDLRNKASFAYFLMNSCFVVVIFTLQANVETVSVPWPCGTNLRLEPIGFMFLIFFGIMMVLQTIGMIVHRAGTLLHIIATTEIDWFSGEKYTVKDALALIEDMVGFRKGNEEDDHRRSSVISTVSMGDNEMSSMRRRPTVIKLARVQTRRPTMAKNMEAAFNERLEHLNTELNRESATAEDIGTKVLKQTHTRRKTVRAINNLKSARGAGHQLNVGNSTPVPPPRRVRCNSLPDEEEGYGIHTINEVEHEGTERPPTTTGVTFSLSGQTPAPMEQSQL